MICLLCVSTGGQGDDLFAVSDDLFAVCVNAGGQGDDLFAV